MKSSRIKCIFIFLGICSFIRPGYSLEKINISDSTHMQLDLTFRSYAIDDQRIYWSGLEMSFGAEASIRASIERKFRGGNLTVESEFFIDLSQAGGT